MLLTSMFWTRDEQPLRMAFWLGCNGISTIVGSGVSWGLGHTNNATLHPWQLVFVVSPVCSEEKVKIVLTTLPGDWSSNILFRYSFGVHSCVSPGRLHILLPPRSTCICLASLSQPHRSQTREDPLVPSPGSFHRPQNILHLCFGNLSRNHKRSYGELLDDNLEEFRIWAPLKCSLSDAMRSVSIYWDDYSWDYRE
jgi:hypothetical protein